MKTNKTIWHGSASVILPLVGAIVAIASLTPLNAAKPPKPPPEPSLDTGTIYYYHRAAGLKFIHSMNPDGSGKQLLLTLDPETENAPYEPSRITHDGFRWFLTLRQVDGIYPSEEPRVELFAMSEDGVLVQLTDAPNVQPAAMPPEYYSSGYGLTRAQPRWLAVGDNEDAMISFLGRQWQEDGTWKHGIFVCPVSWDGGPSAPPVATLQLPLPNEYYAAIRSYDWSPDLKSVAFCAFDVLTLWVIDTEDPMFTPQPLLTDYYLQCLRWSPVQPTGGSQIAFINGVGRNSELQVINPDGTGLRTLVVGNVSRKLYHPVLWSPHGTHLTYEMGMDGVSGIYWFVYRVAADGSGHTALTDKSESPADLFGWTVD